MLPMPRSLATPQRVVLMPTARRSGERTPGPVLRRYRLARVAPAPRTGEDRFAHLKRAHD